MTDGRVHLEGLAGFLAATFATFERGEVPCNSEREGRVPQFLGAVSPHLTWDL